MAEIINLREFRKSRERKAKSAKAAGNRARSGQSKADAAREKSIAEREKAEFDGKLLDRATSESDKPGETD